MKGSLCLLPKARLMASVVKLNCKVVCYPKFESSFVRKSFKILKESERETFATVAHRKIRICSVKANNDGKKSIVATQGSISLPKISDEEYSDITLSVLIPIVLGFAVSLIFNPNSKWYNDLKKPWWNPPRAIFAPVWVVLYSLLGFSAWLVYKKGGGLAQDALTVYGVQLGVNFLWPFVFFGAKKIGLALATNVFLWIGVLSTIKAFKPLDNLAALLLLPYLAWVTFATILNYSIWHLNKDH